MKGGYQIIDLRGTNFTPGTAVTVSDVYNQIESNYYKPLLLEGFSIANVDLNATWVTITAEGSNFKLVGVPGYDVTVTSADEVTVSAITSGGNTE